MSELLVDVSPRMLQWAWKRAGLQTTGLKKWLDSSEKPTLPKILNFAERTGVPLDVLLGSSIPQEKVQIPDMRAVKGARLAEPSGNLLDTISAIQHRQIWFREWMEEEGRQEVDLVGSVAKTRVPERVASDYRQVFGYPPSAKLRDANAAFRWLSTGMESAGILVMRSGSVPGSVKRTLDQDEFRGFSLSDAMAPVIFVNTKDSEPAQLFTLIHEFGHILLGHSALSNPSTNAELLDSSKTEVVTHGREEETWCDRFAAEFLIPLGTAQALARGRSVEILLQELPQTAFSLHVSSQTLLSQYYSAGKLSWDQYVQKRDELRQQPYKSKSHGGKGGPDSSWKGTVRRTSPSFFRAVADSVEQGRTSYIDACNLTGVKKIDTFTNAIRVAREMPAEVTT